MKFMKLGLIVGLIYWITERAWEKPEILWSLLFLGLGGAAIGAIMDFVSQSRKPPKASPRDDVTAKKQAYMEKLKQKKAAARNPNKDDLDCL